jgi:oxalate decarboxylase/phosphoglucose isomerase-like protein (cupin superfamily)
MPRNEPCVVHETDCPQEGWDDATRGRVVWRTLLSGDRTPTGSLTLGVVEIGPGDVKELYPHRHAQPEAYYILAGEGVVTLAGTGHPVRPGSAVFVPGNAAHCARNTGATQMRILYVFAADSFDEIRYEFESDETSQT